MYKEFLRREMHRFAFIGGQRRQTLDIPVEREEQKTIFKSVLNLVHDEKSQGNVDNVFDDIAHGFSNRWAKTMSGKFHFDLGQRR